MLLLATVVGHSAPSLAANGSLSTSLSVLDYGATGDGVTLDSAAIAKTFAACRDAATPGTEIVFPAPGRYLTGPWELSCNASTVIIEAGATVVALNATLNWPIGRLPCPEPSQGRTTAQAAPFILADSVDDVTVTGGGVIDARGKMFWDEHCGNWCVFWVGCARVITTVGAAVCRHQTHPALFTLSLPSTAWQVVPAVAPCQCFQRNASVRVAPVYVAHSQFATIYPSKCLARRLPILDGGTHV